MPITKSHLASLGIAAFMACAIPALAQDFQDLVQAEIDIDIAEQLENRLNPRAQLERVERSALVNDLEKRRVENRYRIGLDCRPARPELKSHLKLDEDTGLMVHMSLPGSPASIAGIRQYDVIVEANGQTVGEVMDLVEQVNEAKGDEMSITLIREGEEHLVKVTPEERDEEELGRLRDGFRNQLGQQGLPGIEAMRPELEEMFKNFPQLNQFGNGAFRRINPGIAMPAIPNLPNSFSIQRSNDKITVQHGDDHYEVTTDTLDELPDNVRPLVENMLNGGQMNFGGLMLPGMQAPALPARPRLPATQVPPAKNNSQLQDRFDGLEIQLRDLQDAIRSLESK